MDLPRSWGMSRGQGAANKRSEVRGDALCHIIPRTSVIPAEAGIQRVLADRVLENKFFECCSKPTCMPREQLRSGIEGNLGPPTILRRHQLSSINIEPSLLTIVLVLVGPAFVFLRVSKAATVLVIYRLHQENVSYFAKTEMPHKDYITYVLFPLALAGVLWLGNKTSLTPLESFDANYLKLIFDPKWLVKYSLFTWIIGMLGMITGAITGFGFAPMAKIFGVQLGDTAPEDEAGQPSESETRPEKRKKQTG